MNKFKDNKGITGVDITISVIVIMLFVSIIGTIFYNVYINSQSINREANAVSYVINILERVENMDYDNVNNSNLETIINTVKSSLNISNSYVITGEIINYNPTGEEQDLIKKVNVIVNYKVGNNQEEINISTLKKKI